MGIVALPSFGSDPATVTASSLDGKVDPLATEFNGNIENANIKAGAAIAYSKLNLATSIVNADISASAAIDASKIDLSPVAQTIAMSDAAINYAKGSDIASATTTDIGAATGNVVDVTGTTTITGLGTVQAGTVRLVQFDGALTLTHNATSLILPGSANITTAAGDCALFQSEGSGNWRCLVYQKKSGSPISVPSGSVVQVVNTQTGAVSTGTTVMVDDDTIPQNTEGNELMTLAITPTSATNKLKIDVVVQGGEGANQVIVTALFQDSTANALAAMRQDGGAGKDTLCTFTHYMTAGTTSSTTFKVRAGLCSDGTYTFNGLTSSRKLGGVMASSITITEIKV